MIEPWIAALIGGMVTLAVAWMALPKVRAEARKTNAETDNIVATGLHAAVMRLSADLEMVKAELGQVKAELAEAKSSAADERALLEKENKCLRAKVERLTRRVRGLEDILRLEPISTEAKALLDELDRSTSGKSDLRTDAEQSIEASEEVLRSVIAEEAKKK